MNKINIICSQKIYNVFFKKYNEELPNDFNKIKELFINKKNDMNSINKEDIINRKKLLETLINAMELSKKFDEIIKNEELPQNPINSDVIKIFNILMKVNIESLLLEKINPSFKFYIIKNMEILKPLINSKLSKSDISVFI